MILSEELMDAFRHIAEMNNVRFRQVKTMFAGLITMQERDLDYMDEHMDVLFDFMDPQSETEMLMRQYYDYIATFDPTKAKERIGSLEDDMGYMTKIVYAAGMVAQKLHKAHVITDEEREEIKTALTLTIRHLQGKNTSTAYRQTSLP